MAKITFILDEGERIEVPLNGDLTIGRVEGNDIVVDDSRISSQHAEVRKLDGGNFEVRDLKSKAGTFVNGERVETHKLAHGDKIAFGPLVAEYEVEGLEATIIAPAIVAPAPPAEDDATEKELERAKGINQCLNPLRESRHAIQEAPCAKDQRHPRAAPSESQGSETRGVESRRSRRRELSRQRSAVYEPAAREEGSALRAPGARVAIASRSTPA